MYDPQLTNNKHIKPMSVEPGPGSDGGSIEDGYLLSLGDFFQVIRKRLWIILLLALVCLAAAVGFSLMQTPMYEGTIKLLVGQERANKDTPTENVMGLEQLTQTMAEGVNSRPVAKAVIEQMNLQTSPKEFLRDYLRVEQIPETQYIWVGYKDTSPERAQEVANTIGDVFSEQIAQASPSASAITATVWERADTPDEPVSPKPLRNGLLGLVVGLVLGVGVAFLLEYLDDSWRSPEEAQQILGVPTFGVVPNYELTTTRKKRAY